MRRSSWLPANLLAILAAAAPLAGAEPDARAALDCWANALGGRERLSAIRAIERTGTIETGGMTGTVRSWHTASGALRTDVDLGPYEATDAFDGVRGWTRSGSSPAHDLDGGDFRRVVSDAYLESLSPLVAGRMKGSVRLVASGSVTVLELAPEGGIPTRVTLDAGSCLPLSTETPDRERTLRVEILEWMEEGGVRLPRMLRQSSGDPAYDIVIRIESVRLDPEIPAGLFEPGEERGGGIDWSGRTRVSTPLELTQNHPYVGVTVNGKGPSMFILDTGADATVIEKGHAATLGLEMEGSIEIRGGGEGTLEASLIAGPTIAIAGLELPAEAVVAIPLGPLGLYEGRPIEGILGYDVLSRFVVELDYGARRVTLHDPATFQAPAGARELPVTFDGNSPVIAGRVTLPDGRTFDARLALDTGNRGALILHAPFVAAHGIRKSLPVLADAPLGMGIGGMTRQDVGRIGSLSLAGFVLNAPLASFSTEAKGANANPEVDGNVGSEALRRFALWIDYRRSRVLLRPNTALAEPFEYDMSGLTLALADWSSTEPVVISVLPGSPADRAGLRPGDRLESVDGRATASLPLEAVRASLMRNGTKVKLQTRRGPERIRVKLELRPLI